MTGVVLAEEVTAEKAPLSDPGQGKPDTSSGNSSPSVSGTDNEKAEKKPENRNTGQLTTSDVIVVETKVIINKTAGVAEEPKKNEQVIDLEAVTKTPSETIKYFCQCWIKDDFKAMYGVLDNTVSDAMGFEKFRKRYKSDAETTLGLAGAKLLDDGKESGAATQVRMELYFRNERVPARRITALLRSTAKGYRVLESGLIPMDMGDM
jgi:hypothetical protein